MSIKDYNNLDLDWIQKGRESWTTREAQSAWDSGSHVLWLRASPQPTEQDNVHAATVQDTNMGAQTLLLIKQEVIRQQTPSNMVKSF